MVRRQHRQERTDIEKIGRGAEKVGSKSGNQKDVKPVEQEKIPASAVFIRISKLGDKQSSSIKVSTPKSQDRDKIKLINYRGKRTKRSLKDKHQSRRQKQKLQWAYITSSLFVLIQLPTHRVRFEKLSHGQYSQQSALTTRSKHVVA